MFGTNFNFKDAKKIQLPLMMSQIIEKFEFHVNNFNNNFNYWT